jgi:hypothetical protein
MVICASDARRPAPWARDGAPSSRPAPPEGLELTRLTVDAWHPLVPPCEAACQAHRAAWRRDGRLRTARRHTTAQNGALPTPEERWRLLVVALQTSPLQVRQGRRCGMGQRQAHQWSPGLWVGRRATRRALGAAPARSVQAWAHRLKGAEAAAAAGGVPPAGPAPAAPLFAPRAPHGASGAPRLLLHSRAVIAARNPALR